MTATLTRPGDVDSPAARSLDLPVVAPYPTRMLAVVGILSLVVGIGAIAGGVLGAWYTYDQAAAEEIVTPEDASIPEARVLGPFTMLAQKDIITEHQLERTGGLRYAEMPRQVAQVDEAGQPVLDDQGQPVMVENEARASWLTATTLTTALGLGILAYALSGLAVVVGIALAGVGFVLLQLRRRELVERML